MARKAETLASMIQSVPLSSTANAIAAASVIARGSKRSEPRSSPASASGAAAGSTFSGHDVSAQRYTSTWVAL